MNISKQKMQKVFNQITLLKIIQLEHRISQAELSIKTKLQPSTVSNLIKEFKQRGIVKITGKGISGEKGGKKSDLLSLNPKQGLFSGVSIKKKSVVFSLFDLMGTQIEQYEKKVSRSSTNDVISIIADEINQLCSQYPNYKGAGIAVTSVINEEGDITYSFENNLKVSHFQADIKSKIPPIQITVENDANCAAYYSNYYLKEKYKNLISYSIFFEPFCIGAGIFFNNKLFKGPKNAAGEIWESISATHKDIDKISIKDIKNPDTNPLVKNLLASIRNYILTTAVFVDTEVIVLNGDIIHIDKNVLADFIYSLKNTYNQFEVKIIDECDLTVAGSAMLSIDMYINTLLKGAAY
ncbi:MAG: ROK family transcriptional regulator [Spirochaetes bacterium]|nr:ROK family transcriptional regulator [Spirochaetota bacterium]